MAQKKPSKKSRAKKPAKKAGGSKLAKSLSQLLAFKKQLRKLEAQQAPLKKKMEDLANQVIQLYSEDDLLTVKLKGGSVTRVSQAVPQIQDFDAFFTFVTEKNAPELLHRRISADAWRERTENGETIPGVEPFTRVSLRIQLKGEASSES